MACGSDLNQLSFVGLVGMCDPLRPGVKEAVEELLRGEVDVKMITGDAKETGEAIGKISHNDSRDALFFSRGQYPELDCFPRSHSRRKRSWAGDEAMNCTSMLCSFLHCFSAHQLGLWQPTSHSLSGDELENLPQSDLIRKIQEVIDSI